MTDKKGHTMSGILAGAFFGGLMGGVTMLLLAPQSGEGTRMKIQQKSIKLLDNLLGRVQDTTTQMRSACKKRLIINYQKVEYWNEQGQTRIVPQADAATYAVQTENKAAQNILLASPHEEIEREDINNLVDQQPLDDEVVNDSMGG